jgi:hypothetical protein
MQQFFPSKKMTLVFDEYTYVKITLGKSITKMQCVHCNTTSTPQWRKTIVGILCNKCGMRHYRELRKLQKLQNVPKKVVKKRTCNEQHHMDMCAVTLVQMANGII